MLITTAEFGELNKIDYQTAAGVMRFLEQKGIALKQKETRPAKSGKGKPSSLYILPTTVSLSFAEPAPASVQLELDFAPATPVVAENVAAPVEAVVETVVLTPPVVAESAPVVEDITSAPVMAGDDEDWGDPVPSKKKDEPSTLAGAFAAVA